LCQTHKTGLSWHSPPSTRCEEGPQLRLRFMLCIVQESWFGIIQSTSMIGGGGYTGEIFSSLLSSSSLLLKFIAAIISPSQSSPAISPVSLDYGTGFFTNSIAFILLDIPSTLLVPCRTAFACVRHERRKILENHVPSSLKYQKKQLTSSCRSNSTCPLMLFKDSNLQRLIQAQAHTSSPSSSAIRIQSSHLPTKIDR